MEWQEQIEASIRLEFPLLGMKRKNTSMNELWNLMFLPKAGYLLVIFVCDIPFSSVGQWYITLR